MGDEVITYADRWTCSPGDVVAIKGSTNARLATARLVRLSVTAGGPELPEVVAEPVRDAEAVQWTGREQHAVSGSCVVVDLASPSDPLPRTWTFAVWFHTAIPAAGRSQGLAGTARSDRARGWSLSIAGDGVLALELEAGRERSRVVLPDPVRPGRWYLAVASFDADSGLMSLTQRALRPDVGEAEASRAVLRTSAADDVWGPGPLVLGAGGSVVDRGRFRGVAHYTGKLGSPTVLTGVLQEDELDQLRDGASLSDRRYAAWDLLPDTARDDVPDLGPAGLPGLVRNGPLAAVTGHSWTGEADDFRLVPEQYRARRFHADDVDDAEWDDDAHVVLGDDLPSGVYAVETTAGSTVDLLPLFVRPAATAARNRVAVLLPTYTYLAYANEHIALTSDFEEAGFTSREVRLGAADRWLAQHPEVGQSLYDLHADGSGVCSSSRLRPIPNLRPDYLNWTTHAPRHFGLDLYLIGWLDHRGIAYDVLTDDGLQAEGAEALRGYDVVLTGSHPEYTTGRMLDALDTHLQTGGRLMYLGGNGFFWVTSVDADHPHRIEVRRGHAGTRPWESAPGEERSAVTGERGGMWRHRGRPPNALVGVGFTSQGWDQKAPGYRRLPDSLGPAGRWVFDGVGDSEVIGDFGYCMDGAASDEIDRFDVALGSPPHALRLATSTGHSRVYRLGLEDLLMNAPETHGEVEERVRADMVLFETPGGGAVFSTGAIGWIGALPVDGYDNNVAKVTGNVLRGFLAPHARRPWAAP